MTQLQAAFSLMIQRPTANYELAEVGLQYNRIIHDLRHRKHLDVKRVDTDDPKVSLYHIETPEGMRPDVSNLRFV